MHFDLAHALVSVILVFGIIMLGQKTEVFGHVEKGKINWKLFGTIFVVILILNLVWPGT
ncbi:MAG: hypothetical protein QNI90_18205 [Dinoroseobacter sp.]|nr:hypothetical protein [Dinoroseobacter sp.]